MKLTYKHTLFACCLSYVVQAIVNNLPTLFYVTFCSELGIELWQISLIITLNFATQILVDLSSAIFVDKIGYRRSVLIASSFAMVGLLSLGLLPRMMSNAFLGILISTVFMAIGGGLNEVVISPMVEALPGDAKASVMNLLHSFYSWGQAGVILLSTVFFIVVGVEKWTVLSVLWAIVPLICLLLFTVVPVATLTEKGESISLCKLFRQDYFFPLLIIMFCAGAAELGMAQWASYFAEVSLGISKTLGDLLGPCAFALCMGIGRLYFGTRGEKIHLEKCIFISFIFCIVFYLIAALSPIPIVALIACALCGLSVAVLWPGTYSLGAKWIPLGGTAMFALFAFGGDVGCTAGPDVLALFSEAVSGGFLYDFLSKFMTGDIGMKAGMLITAVFPIIGAIIAYKFTKKEKKKSQ